MEVTPETLRAMVENCSDELVPGEYIQTAQDILAGGKFCSETNSFLTQVLDYFQTME